MQKLYLIKQFDGDTPTLNIVDDRPEPLSPLSVWYWINEAANKRIKACFFAMEDVDDRDEFDKEILIVDAVEPNRPHVVEWAKNLRLAELKADPDFRVYQIKCVLDLS